MKGTCNDFFLSTQQLVQSTGICLFTFNWEENDLLVPFKFERYVRESNCYPNPNNPE